MNGNRNGLAGSPLGADCELECLTALVDGKDAWPEFLEIYGKHLHCRFRDYSIGPGSTRDDLLQDLALRLISNERRVLRDFLENNRGGSFKALLTKIVRSVVIDHIRKHQRHASREVLVSYEHGTMPSQARQNDDPGKLIEEDAEIAALLAQVASQNSHLGLRTLKRFISGFSVSEIARRTGTSPNTVSQRLRYYRGKLKAIIESRKNAKE